jgi:DNA polymerase elongation subunit (family B)
MATPSGFGSMRLVAGKQLRILDFDCETRATGFGDPQWVPQEITCIAWSWIGDDEVSYRLRCKGAKRMMQAFLKVYAEADVLTGHNIRRFDLPTVNAECLRFGFPSLAPKMTQDTLRDIVRTKGMKRDQDNLGKQLGLPVDKLTMGWHDWHVAYLEKGWPMVAERAMTDVVQHKLMRIEMMERGWLREPRVWAP